MEEYDKDNVVAVIEQDLKDYDKSLLHTASIEDALIRDKVYLDANILTNAADVLSRYPDISSIPVLTDDDRILYLAEDSPELTEWMMRLCCLEREDAVWQNISSVRIKGFHEAFLYFHNFLQEKGIEVFAEGEIWEKLGVPMNCGECPEDAWTIGKDGEEIDRLYSEMTKRNVWEDFCREIKENGSEVIFCCVPDGISEKIYDSLLREGILPKAIWHLDQFHALFGEKAISVLDTAREEIYCLAGKKGDDRVDKIFDLMMRRQNGYCGNIYLLSEIGDSFPDTMLSDMIRHCGKAVLMGEKRLCGLLQKYCCRLDGTEAVYVDGKEQVEAGLRKNADALWFWLGFPSRESQVQYIENYEALRQSGVYLSRYFSDHYMYYGEEWDPACFEQDEADEMACLRKLQAAFDECRRMKDASSDRECEVLFYGPLYSYGWSGVEPLFQYYMKQGNVRCTVVFPSVREIVTIGKQNLRKITDIVSDIRRWGGQVGLYEDDWYLERKYDVCYLILGYSPWHARKGVFRSSKAVIALQSLAYHTHYYQGNEKFENIMFPEQHRKEIDGAAVSRFMAEWAGQKEEKWRAKLFPLGYPKMDSIYEELKACRIPDKWQKIAAGKKVFFSTVYNADLFQCCVRYCERDKAVLIWRPHPLWFEASHDVERAIIEEWKKKKNVIIDENSSYGAAFCISDALISIYCASVQINYLFTDKPILILDKGYLESKIDFEEEPWYQAAYTANNEKECLEFIEMVMDGRDDKKEEKLPYRRFMQQGFDGKACQRIAEFAEKNYTTMRLFR